MVVNNDKVQLTTHDFEHILQNSLWKEKQKVLVDTVSAVSLVKKSILQDEKNIEPSVIDLHGVNGDSIIIHGKVQDILCRLHIAWYVIRLFTRRVKCINRT